MLQQSGFDITFQHLDGHDVRVQKSGVTSPGDVVQIKKEGMPRRGGSGKTVGSLFIRFSISFPKVSMLVPFIRFVASFASVFV